MRFAAALCLCALLGGCANVVQTIDATMTGDDGRWLIGTWCANRDGPEPTRFYADGRYTTYAESGRWDYLYHSLRLRRSSPERASTIFEVEPLTPTTFAWTIDGTRETWHRCRATP